MSAQLALSAVKELAEALAARYLADYVHVLSEASKPVIRRKEVNDSLWGTIVLNPIEVVVLDSPLLQRLRYIRQLGAVHWVYPGAVHTRFEHALGRLHQTDQLVSALNSLHRLDSQTDGAVPLISEDNRQLLRLCALMCDTGQLAFSKASEAALEELPPYATLPKAFSSELQNTVRGEDPGLSQIFAFYISTSPAMTDLLKLLLRRYSPNLRFASDEAANVGLIVEKLSRALVGRKISDELPLLHELVSGPYDAGKLDSLIRDARFSGIPTVLDIQRLLQKLAVRRLSSEELPDEIGGTISLLPGHTASVFGVRPAATSVLDELQLARVLGSTKIDRHPKVLAVEQMLRSVIQAKLELTDPLSVVEFLYTHSDDAILAMSAADLASRTQGSKSTQTGIDDERIEVAAKTLACVRERRLWVRAFQLPEPDVAVDDEHAGLANLRDDMDHVQRRVGFLKCLRDEVQALAATLIASPPTRAALDLLVMARTIKPTSSETQIGRAYVVPEGRPFQLSWLMKRRGNWVELYMRGQTRSHVFSPAELADVVYVAVERVVHRQYGAVVPRTALETSKRNGKEITALKRKLPPQWWRGFPFELRPTPERLERSDVQNRIREFDELCASIHMPGPSRAKNATKTWLRQFETEDDVECALMALGKFKVLTAQDTVAAVRTFVENNPELLGAWVVPFGGLKDGSSLQAYFARELQPQVISEIGTLDEYAARGTGKPLIVLEDFVGSGKQGSDILGAWFAEPGLRSELNEAREPLSEEARNALSSANVGFVLVSAWDDGITMLTEAASRLSLNARVYAHIREAELPFVEPVLQAANVPRVKIDAFLARCDAIGSDLNNSRPNPPPVDVVKARARGYGGRGMLLATPINVPTQTLTAIWMDGKVEETVPWSVLLRRRKKT